MTLPGRVAVILDGVAVIFPSLLILNKNTFKEEYNGGYFFFFFLGHAGDVWGGVACGILVPLPGIQPMLPVVEAQNPNHWTPREVPRISFKKKFYYTNDNLEQFWFIGVDYRKVMSC